MGKIHITDWSRDICGEWQAKEKERHEREDEQYHFAAKHYEEENPNHISDEEFLNMIPYKIVHLTNNKLYYAVSFAAILQNMQGQVNPFDTFFLLIDNTWDANKRFGFFPFFKRLAKAKDFDEVGEVLRNKLDYIKDYEFGFYVAPMERHLEVIYMDKDSFKMPNLTGDAPQYEDGVDYKKILPKMVTPSRGDNFTDKTIEEQIKLGVVPELSTDFVGRTIPAISEEAERLIAERNARRATKVHRTVSDSAVDTVDGTTKDTDTTNNVGDDTSTTINTVRDTLGDTVRDTNKDTDTSTTTNTQPVSTTSNVAGDTSTTTNTVRDAVDDTIKDTDTVNNTDMLTVDGSTVDTSPNHTNASDNVSVNTEHTSTDHTITNTDTGTDHTSPVTDKVDTTDRTSTNVDTGTGRTSSVPDTDVGHADNTVVDTNTVNDTSTSQDHTSTKQDITSPEQVPKLVLPGIKMESLYIDDQFTLNPKYKLLNITLSNAILEARKNGLVFSEQDLISLNKTFTKTILTGILDDPEEGPPKTPKTDFYQSILSYYKNNKTDCTVQGLQQLETFKNAKSPPLDTSKFDSSMPKRAGCVKMVQPTQMASPTIQGSCTEQYRKDMDEAFKKMLGDCEFYCAFLNPQLNSMLQQLLEDYIKAVSQNPSLSDPNSVDSMRQRCASNYMNNVNRCPDICKSHFMADDTQSQMQFNAISTVNAMLTLLKRVENGESPMDMCNSFMITGTQFADFLLQH